ncbi:ferrous iron transport protein B [Wenyingzhuangia marina]|uniref:Ferrous iron transport protein B n=1 Tax=Wenyingzhuangia marina TaxID=1195760 RepID=A0A1M5TWT8_9FLAO|nr:ferrous iron transport protein B [Wenyingzhuangia marina]GGF70616.1 ferrous iron transport protein B [Wenyingzhuangia marina]SHH55257.1 ferrous iron transport protein B [Wenyingzhuangia marina]
MSDIKVALIGNPNTGKTSLFNRLTGLNQKVGNYPGITVDKKVGHSKLNKAISAEIIDLPGTYSLNASSLDEDVAVQVLSDKTNENYPDVVVVVVDIENLKRNLYLYTQVKDLGIPTILAVNMADQMKNRGIDIDMQSMESLLETKIALVSSKQNKGISFLKKLIVDYKSLSTVPCFIDEPSVLSKIVNTEKKKHHLETVRRYQFIKSVLEKTYSQDPQNAKDLRSLLDRVLIHKYFGYLIFFTILFSIFQALFSWSAFPMDYIDSTFAGFSEMARAHLPEGVFTNLLAEGIIPGIGGVVIFIPQIAFLFLFTSVLEESGYMSRVVFLMDKIMRKFGLSGKSIVPLISGTACAIPAIMAARNIENWKERLITILVTPFTTCSARLPVYAIIISLIVPAEARFMSFNVQGLMLMALYLLGFGVAILSAMLLDKFLKLETKSYFVIEMPNYKLPLFKNVAYTVIEKTKAFVFEAGKIILAISILLWVLASYGPGKDFSHAKEIVTQNYPDLNEEELNAEIASYKLENSYIGIMGKTIEPVIRPLGYDWKIGVAVITSFAAREVFVGTLATIYSVGSEEESTIKDRMRNEVFQDSKKPVYSFATGVSILLFYAFAMQCMSTIAIVKRETNGWKWPLIQMFVMSGFAYLTALIAYQILK